MNAATVRRWAIVLVLGMTMPARGQEPPANKQPAKGRVDRYGDPLPEGAVARLGSIRFRHYGAVHAVAFSRDGKLLAASSDGRNMVVIWERATGRKLREISIAGQTLPPSDLRFSPDSKRLYSGGGYAWDVETGASAKDLSPQPPKGWTLGYSPDFRQIILLQKDTEIVRWDMEKGTELGRYTKPGDNLLTAALVEKHVLVPQFDGKVVRMWDVAQKKELWSVETTRDEHYPGLPMTFSADGRLFAVEAPARMISVCEALTGKVIRRIEGAVGGIYYSLSISPDGRTVAGSNWDGSLHLWNLENGRERCKIPTIQGWTTHIFFAPDSKSFATGGPNNAHGVLLWETATGKPTDPFPGHTSPVSSVSFSPDGRTVATSSRLRGDSVVRLWNPETGKLAQSLEAPTAHGVAAVAFSPDGRTLAACGWFGDNRVRLWDVATGRERHVLAGHEAGCNDVAFSPDGKRLASSDAYYNPRGKYEGRLCIWDVEAGKRVREIRGTPGAIQRVLFTADGRRILAGADRVHVYNVETGKLVGEPFGEGRIWDLSLSPDGRLLATNNGNQVQLWELATHREIPLTVPGGKGCDGVFAPDGRTLAILVAKEVVLVHWPSGETVGRLAGDEFLGARIVFSPDGKRLATAGNTESSVLIWEVTAKVKPSLAAKAKPSAAELRSWWGDLRDENPGPAFKAVWGFVAAGEEAVPILANSLTPVKAVDPTTVNRLILDLDSDQFEVRDKASRELARVGEAVVDALEKAKKGELSAEQKGRINQLLDELSGPVPGPEQRRALRAVAALEQIGSPAARKALTIVAAGAEGASLTQEAKAALERLKRTERDTLEKPEESKP